MKKVSAFETAYWVAGLIAIMGIALYLQDNFAIGKPWKLYAADFEWVTPDALLAFCVGGLVLFCCYWGLLVRGARWNVRRREGINMRVFGNPEGKLTADHINDIAASLRGKKEGK